MLLVLSGREGGVPVSHVVSTIIAGKRGCLLPLGMNECPSSWHYTHQQSFMAPLYSLIRVEV